MTKPAKAILADIYDAWRAHDLDWLGTYLPAGFSHSLNIPMEMLPAGGLRLGKGAGYVGSARSSTALTRNISSPAKS
jgi:hypothetical protein